jgi:hypothetical protein
MIRVDLYGYVEAFAAVAIFHLLSTNFPDCGISRARFIRGRNDFSFPVSRFTFCAWWDSASCLSPS